jgi:UDP-N-acetylglucosamine transferase subunit ALG13
VVPRRREHGEAVDDHQVVLARRLAESGLVTVVDDPAELPEILAGLNGGALTTAPRPDARLVEELRSFVVDRVDARRR